MSRDTNGTYTLPTNSFAQPVAGTVIDPTDAAATLDDIETALTDSISKTGLGRATALAVGQNLPSADDSAYIACRGLAPVSGLLNSHAYRDETAAVQAVTAAGFSGYASFDAIAVINGTCTTPMNHIRGFQSRETYNSTGTVNEFASFWSGPITALGTVGALYHYKVANVNIIAPSVVTSQYALYSDTLSGATNNYFLWGGSNSSQFNASVTIATTDGNGLAVGPSGSTNPTLQVDASTASAATGIKIKSAAAAAGAAISVISSGTNENLKIDAKGSGTITFGATSTGAVNVTGTRTNDSAATGIVGEYVSSTIASGSAVSLSTGVSANITSISLTAGDWDVQAMPRFTGGATTTVGRLQASISLNSATNSTVAGCLADTYFNNQLAFNVTDPTLGIPAVRISLAATTTVYLVANAVFGISTAAAYGIISARRLR